MNSKHFEFHFEQHIIFEKTELYTVSQNEITFSMEIFMSVLYYHTDTFLSLLSVLTVGH